MREADPGAPSSTATAGGGFTAPLGLVERLRPPKLRLDGVAVLDLLALALLTGLLFTRFVLLPGVRVDLPVTELRMKSEAESVSVLTIENRGMLFFDGNVYGEDGIGKALDERAADFEGMEPVLLVKAQADMNLQAFLDIVRMAEEAGFARVQVSGREVAREPETPGPGVPEVGPFGSPEGQ